MEIVVVVDDVPEIEELFKETLSGAGFDVRSAGSFTLACQLFAALTREEARRVRAIISDQSLEGYGRNGIDLLVFVKNRAWGAELSEAAVLLTSGEHRPGHNAALQELGIPFMTKPVNIWALRRWVSQCPARGGVWSGGER